ncbi:UDP-galactose transporter 1-like isoform X2 [Apium graveolens]|uniref:UDP-galactose transporter 1-like isoform X2 n=1 Tax=Apium graveolens TaxID=4045 RepID=UPI003D78E26E
MMEDGSVFKSIFAILQWWGFNVPVIIINKWIFQWLVWRKYFDWRIWASLVPIVGGILLTSLTELSFNMLGFCAALFGCLATSTKTILAELLLHGFKFDRAPFATMILAVPALLLEGTGVLHWVQTCPSLLSSLVIIFGPGMMAFCLNFSIFYVIHSTTAVTFNVAGNMKARHHVCRLLLLLHIQEPDLPYECCRMHSDTCWMYIVWVYKAFALPTATSNS